MAPFIGIDDFIMRAIAQYASVLFRQRKQVSPPLNNELLKIHISFKVNYSLRETRHISSYVGWGVTLFHSQIACAIKEEYQHYPHKHASVKRASVSFSPEDLFANLFKRQILLSSPLCPDRPWSPGNPLIVNDTGRSFPEGKAAGSFSYSFSFI
jgi:hypothetical protein